MPLAIKSKPVPIRNAKRPSPARVDPSRTFTLRRKQAAIVRARFGALKKAVRKLVADEDAFGLKTAAPFDPVKAVNAFCPTGEGGGVDPSCSPGAAPRDPAAAGKALRALSDAFRERTHAELESGVRELLGKLSTQGLKTALTAAGYDYLSAARGGKARVIDEAVRVLQDRKASWDRTAFNAFCPTGEGGGVDPTCSPGGGSGKVRPVHDPAFVGKKIEEAIAERPSRAMHGDTGNNSFFIYDDGRVLAWDHPERKSRELKGAHMVHSHSGDRAPGQPDLEFQPHNADDVKILLDGLKKGDKTASTVIMDDGRMETLRISPDATSEQKKALGKLTAKQLKKDINPTYDDSVKAWKERGVKQHDLSREHVAAFAHHYGLEYTMGNWKTGESKSIPAPDWYYKMIGQSPPVRNAGRFAFRSSQERVRAFQAWLAAQFKALLTSEKEEELWRRYAEAGYRKGAGRAFEDVKKPYAQGRGKTQAEEYAERPPGGRYRTARGGFALEKPVSDFYAGTKEEFLRSAFGRPVAVEKVKLMAGRAFDDLKNVTTDMSARMSRSLTDAIVAGKGPREAARDLDKVVDLAEGRALLIARTEIIRAHSEGQLDAMELLGVPELGVEVEWSTTGDDKVCPLCEDMEGKVFTVEEARGMIPRHPNCRCAFTPRIPRDLIGNARKRGGLIANFARLLNVFCPTGAGGGVDPTCGKDSPASATVKRTERVSSTGSPRDGAHNDYYRVDALADFAAIADTAEINRVNEMAEGARRVGFEDVEVSQLTSTQSVVEAETLEKIVASGKVEGSHAKVFEDEDGTRYLLDGHTRAVAASVLGQPLPAAIYRVTADALNVFCPTGQGGGVDPSCGRGGPPVDKGKRVPNPIPATPPDLENELEDALAKFAAPDTVKEFIGYSASEELVPIERLTSPQRKNRPEIVQHFEDNPELIEEGKLPLVIQYGAHMFLRDGNSRTTAAMKLGRTHVKARVVFVPEKVK